MNIVSLVLHDMEAEIIVLIILFFDHDIGEKRITLWSVTMKEIETGLFLEAERVGHIV